MAETKRNTVELDANQLDELSGALGKALGIAMALSEKSGNEHDSNAADAIADYLYSAKKILGGEEAAND